MKKRLRGLLGLMLTMVMVLAAMQTAFAAPKTYYFMQGYEESLEDGVTKVFPGDEIMANVPSSSGGVFFALTDEEDGTTFITPDGATGVVKDINGDVLPELHALADAETYVVPATPGYGSYIAHLGRFDDYFNELLYPNPLDPDWAPFEEEYIRSLYLMPADPISYSVAFDGNGGEGTMGDQAFTYGAAQALTKNAFALTGYAFTQWNTADDGTGTGYADEQEVKDLTAVDGDTVDLYAQWAPIGYSVAFDANGGEGTMTEQVFVYDAAQKLTKNAFTRTGYAFTGWNTAADGSGTEYTNEQEVKNLAAADGDMVKLYAQWAPIGYSVAFDANGGEGTMAEQAFVYDAAQKLTKNAFALTGYGFVGWNTAADGSGAEYTNEQEVKNLAAADGGTVKLYAQWAPVGYSVAFDANGGEGTMAEQVFVYDAAQKLTKNAFARDKYTFTGWNTAEDGKGTSYADEQEVKNLAAEDGAEITLYAQWKAVPTPAPATSDNAPLMLWVCLMIISLGACVVLWRRKHA